MIAYSLVHGIPKIKAFTPEALKDARTIAMAKLVTAGADPQLGDAFGESPSILKITLKDGADVRAAARLRDGVGEDPADAGAARRKNSWTARRRP